ncbi:uncharacterized protein LOC141677740 isoform X2 [Apium graveolens]|uniref:uncharacterized protein LOC141677740 isoform X2 n=1 Tax=Apium graveolens TaxID=4045 RepID=UPI003D796A4C
MGHSKQFHGKKQRNNNKASRSRKARQRTEKNRAAGASSISEENMNSDDHDLETVAAFRVSIAADACTNPKRKDSHDLESRGPNSDLVFTPKTEIRSISDDQTPRCINPLSCEIYDYYLKSWNTKDDVFYIAKTDMHTGFDDQTTTASGYAYDLKTWHGDYVPATERHTMFDATMTNDYYSKSWNTKDDEVYIAKTDIHTGFDDQTTTDSGYAEVLKRWSARGDGVYIADDETLNGLPFLDRAEVSKSRSTHSDGVYIAENLDAC